MSTAKIQYNPSLDGVRALASFGIMATHVAFQTGVDPATHLGAILARFDYFVAVFFALSAALLWQSVGRYEGRWRSYFRNRAGRILPAYLCCVLATILLLPDASDMSMTQILANLSMTQIYVADGLAPGLTHLWSLCVEVAFYLVLPLLALCLAPLRQRVRIIALSGLAILSLGWAYAVEPIETEINLQIWPPAYTLWFVVGMLATEYRLSHPPLKHRRWVLVICWLSALAVAWVAGQEFFGPLGLTHPTPGEFLLRTLGGALFGALIVVPCVLAPGPAPAAGSWLGKISYSIFLWHLPVMALVFPLTGMAYFSGGFWVIYLLTAGLSTIVAWASYEFVEEPARLAIRHAKPRQQAKSTETSPPA